MCRSAAAAMPVLPAQAAAATSDAQVLVTAQSESTKVLTVLSRQSFRETNFDDPDKEPQL